MIRNGDHCTKPPPTIVVAKREAPRAYCRPQGPRQSAYDRKFFLGPVRERKSEEMALEKIAEFSRGLVGILIDKKVPSWKRCFGDVTTALATLSWNVE